MAVPDRTCPDHLALGVGLIRRSGAKDPTVVQALLRLLSTVATLALDEPDIWTAIEGEAGLLLIAAEREVVEPADLAVVHAEAEELRRTLSARRAGVSSRRSAADAKELPTTPPT